MLSLVVALQGIKVSLLANKCPEWGVVADNPGCDMSPGCLMCSGGRIICLQPEGERERYMCVQMNGGW